MEQEELYRQASVEYGVALERLIRAYEADPINAATCFRKSISFRTVDQSCDSFLSHYGGLERCIYGGRQIHRGNGLFFKNRQAQNLQDLVKRLIQPKTLSYDSRHKPMVVKSKG